MAFNFRKSFTRFLQRRSFDNQEWLRDWLRGKEVGTETFSGIPISPERAIQYSAILACSRILSEGIASVPLFTYKRINDGKEKAIEHSLYNILHLQPNEEMTSFSFREMMMLHLIFWGNFYAEIEEDGAGEVTALWPLLPWKMTVFRDSSGKIGYKYKLPDNTEKIIPKDYMLHIPGLSFDGLVGKSLISCAREAIGLGLALEEFGARFFGQGTQFGGFIEHPKTINPTVEANLRSALKEKYQGITNSHRIIILEEAMKFSPNSIPPDEAQFLESRKFQKNEIAMIFNISPHLLKDLDRATFNNIEQLGIEHVVYTLRPWCVRIEQSMTIKLLTSSERITYFIEFLLDGLLRGDIASRYAAYAIGRQWGWLSANDVRKLENMNPLPDKEGDIYLIPLNMIDAKQAGDMKALPAPKDNPDDQNNQNDDQNNQNSRDLTLKSRIAANYRGLFEETILRVIKFERNHILKIASSIFGKKSSKTVSFDESLEEFYKDNYDEINKRIKPVIDTYGKAIADAESFMTGSKVNNVDLDKFMNDYSQDFNKKYIDSSKNSLNEIIKNTISKNLDPYKEIENNFNEMEQNRPQKIALEEMGKIADEVSLFMKT